MRKCSMCGLNKEEFDFSPSSYKMPQHYKVNCRACQNKLVKSKQTYKRVNKKGYIYAIKTPAYPDWVKIGCTITSPEQRLTTYQTCSPFRDFYILHSKYTSSIMDESIIIEKLKSNGYTVSYEWCNIDDELAILLIDELCSS